MKTRDIGGNAPFYLFCASLAIIVSAALFAYGVLAQRYNLFPLPVLRDVVADLRELLDPSDEILTPQALAGQAPLEMNLPDQVAPGLLMIAGIRERGRSTYVRIMDREGTVLHEWNPVWSEVWPDVPDSIPGDRHPKGGVGMYLHGLELLPDASIVANFEHLSTFRMDVCGEVMWKLDNLGHHAVHYSDQGELWVAAERFVPRGEATGYQNHSAPLRSWTLQNLGDQGEVLREIEMIDVLLKNDLLGLLYLSNVRDSDTLVLGDTLHLNDVDIFPADMPSEVFEPGDIMTSLRNINTVMVFDAETLEMRFVSTGHVLRHHDPDFLPGDIISVFDNRNLVPSRQPIRPASRIVEIDARTGASRVVLDGQGENGFFTAIMGVHQRLENGNILVTSSDEGTVIEYLPDGTIAWRFSNRIEPDLNGRIFLTQILPRTMDKAFFETARAKCPQ